jgi:lipopolysaccharide biosynthesis glycosyltransferase
MLKRLSPRDRPTDPIHVAYAADANYGPYAGVSMASVLRRFPWDWRDVHFHLLADGVNGADIERMRSTIKDKGFSQLSIYDVRDWFRRDLNFLKREPKYLTRAAYSRLFLAELLPTSINRIIYLDCDTLALADISDLWTFTKDTPVMADCPDTHINAHMPEHKQEIGMYPHAPYFTRAW